MKRMLRALAFGALALLVIGVATAAGRTAARVPVRTVASWPFTPPYGSFAESMARGPDGSLYVSRTIWGDTTDLGVIERVSPSNGSRTTVTGPVNVDGGLFAGVTFDGQGRLYVALATFSSDPKNLPGVARVGPNGQLTRVLTLPPNSFPNGLAFHGNWLYVTDPLLGAVWRTNPTNGPSTPAHPWLADPALAPVTALGPDGVAFRGDTMYVTQYDRGQMLRVDVHADGSPGTLGLFAQDPKLVTADGIMFDPAGNLWVTVNGPGTGRLIVVQPSGHVVAVASNDGWLDYPTQPVVVWPWSVYVVNGSFDNGIPSVVEVGLPFVFGVL